MAINIIATRVAGNQHRHITALRWQPTGQAETEDTSTQRDIIDWLRSGGEAYVQDSDGTRLRVLIAEPATGMRHLRAFDESIGWSDALLRLPRF
jgi:hypothetical protein